MIDIETLATTPDAVVMSVGAVKFDPTSEQPPINKTLWRPDIDEQTERDRNVSETARRLSMHRRTLQRILAKRSPK